MNQAPSTFLENATLTSSGWRALIVEDTPLDTLHLKRMLSGHPEVTVVGEATTVADAADLCEKLQPDLLFLDILLSNLSAFDLLPKLNRLPAIIFVTAHSQFALRAFEINAVDYLIKPVYADRLAITLARLRTEANTDSGTSPRGLQREDITILPISRNFRVVPTRHISCVRAEANYSTVTLIDGNEYLIYRSMQQWEACLPPSIFFRLNRSIIIAPAHLERIKITDRDMAEIIITGAKEPFEIGRTTLARLKKIMKAPLS